MATLQHFFNQSMYLPNSTKKHISATTGLTEDEVYVSENIMILLKYIKYLAGTTSKNIQKVICFYCVNKHISVTNGFNENEVCVI